MLTQLIYTSRAVKPFTPQELEHLLDRARTRNLLCAITGMLLYDYGAFLQVLEGPEKGVNEVFGWIERDPMHRSIQVLEREPIAERAFADWSMGFVDLGSAPLRPAAPMAWTELATGKDAGSRARRYLQIFQADLYRQLAGKDPGRRDER
jgi:hypothetical protein